MSGEALVAFRVSGRLSPREHVVLQLISRGHTNKRVAQSLGITPETVKSHTKHIYVKLGAQSRLEAVMRGLKLGLLRMR